METLKGLGPSFFFLSDSHAANAAAMAFETGSVRVTCSPSTPATATPRISLYHRRKQNTGFRQLKENFNVLHGSSQNI